MKIKSFNNNPMGTNTYIISKNDEAIIVDPVGDLDSMAAYLEKENLKVSYIILTHGHGDHILLASELKNMGLGSICIHEDDEEMINDADLNLSPHFGRPTSLNSDRQLKDGDELNFGDEKIKVIHTPGHTPGCICLEIGDILITGDTLFKGAIGRTDLPGGDYSTMMQSLKKIVKLNPDLKVYPGHMDSSTLKEELRSNPYLAQVK